MTYTMAKRAIRVFKDTGAKRLADEQVSNDFIWATMDVTTKLIGLVILAPLYIVASPFMLINWIADRHAVKVQAKDKADRYRRYLEKRAQK
jgi:hypothetical protein